MGFFTTTTAKRIQGPSDELLHKLECRACPLNKITSNHNPHMEPTGVDDPLVYILGDVPSQEEDSENEQFVGKSGRLLKSRIPSRIFNQARFNNIIRTRPLKNATPGRIEIECCRPSVERDIAQSKPKAIFGYGNLPLNWVSGFSGITEWRGRRIPVNISGHHCWYFAFSHPSYLLRRRPTWNENKHPSEIGSEEERAFKFDMQRAIASLDELPEPVVHNRAIAEEGVEIYSGKNADDFRKLKAALKWAALEPEAGLDFETQGWRPYAKNAKLLSCAISNGSRNFAFGLEHSGVGFSTAQLEEIWELFVKFLASPCKKWVHNLAYEMEWIGVRIDPWLLRSSEYECSLMQASTLDERRGERGDKGSKRFRRGKPEKGPLSLEFLCRQYFGFSLKGLSKVNLKNLDKEDLDAVLKYNAMDAKYHYLVGKAQQAELKRQKMTKVYKRGLRRIATVVLTQIQGIDISSKATQKLRRKYERQIEQFGKIIAESKAAKRFQKLTKHAFNPGSPPDTIILCRDILKSKAGVSTKYDKKKRETRDVYLTTEDILEKINHPVTLNIIKLRKALHKHSTYLYDNHVWPDGKVHAIFNPGFFTDTFRLSSNDPNLQNIPKREAGNQEVRKQIVALPGHSLVAIDYGQIEARVIAMASKDPAFVKSFWDRTDVHMKWAKIIAKAYPRRIGGIENLTDEKVMKDFRTDIKNQWTFPLFFGAILESVAKYLHIPPEKIDREYRQFQREYHGVFEWQKTQINSYNELGYTESLFGRKRRAPMSRNELINAPIQCLMCELVMEAMSFLSERAQREEDWYFQPRLQIHDDLTFMLPDNKLDFYISEIVDEMLAISNISFVNVPITLEVSVGKSLYKMTEIFKASSDMDEYEWSKGYEEWANRRAA